MSSMDGRAHNLEIKARCPDLEAARAIAQQLCGGHAEVELQTDTYFHVAHGRLKLREIEGRPAVLIAYDRPDSSAARTSAYHLVPVADAGLLKAALTASLGVRVIVRKRREIYLWHNVRIHLDDVEGLGRFLELEAVFSPRDDESVCRSRLEHLCSALRITSEAQLGPSYGEMLQG